MDNHAAQIQNAIEHLRHGISVLEEDPQLVSTQEGRDSVYARYGRSFSPEQLQALTAEEYRSFLLFENNRHWTDMQRYGSRTTRDMEALRRALSLLVDENRPLPERYDEAVNSVIGVGRAIATAILHVVYPERYGVWNSKAEAGLKALHILPDRPRGTTEGQYYAAVNEVFLQLAAGLGIDLWSLDTLWEWMAQPDIFVQQRPDLAPPFDTIFADREQAEWAFDFLAGTVKRLGGGPDDQRFALTLPKGRNLMRLNYGNSVVVDIVDGGQTLHLTALAKAMESAFSFERWSTFQGVTAEFNVYNIPVDRIRDWAPGLKAVYEQSIGELGNLFSGWGRSNLLSSHVDAIFQALFDVEKREELLSRGLSPQDMQDMPNEEPAMSVLHSEFEPDPSNSIARQFTGFTADAFKFMAELHENNNKAWMEENRERWRNAVLEPMRALFSDLGPVVKEKFDPFLIPDELEIRATAHHVLARIYKNWAATPDSLYHEYYWGAFYRKGLSRQTDNQLYITTQSHLLRYGFYTGNMAKSLRELFHQRVSEDPEGFYALIEQLQLTSDFEFIRRPEPEVREAVPMTNPNDLFAWLGTGDFELAQSLSPEKAVALGSALVDQICFAFRRLFPIYLWAIADEPKPLIEEYLEVEFPLEIREEEEEEDRPEPYTFDDFLTQTYLSQETAGELLDLLHDRRQIILSGPPGTGKTWVARHLSRLLTGLADPPAKRSTIVQFHPAYGYEEFIEGIRPQRIETQNGSAIDYKVRPGAFVRFCREAARLGNEPCVFIVDEINRGNIPRIFGELMMLLEYRDEDILLPYSGDKFSIPRNVYIIGTMNTADRSIALVDFALRRRFHFFDFPADPALFERWLAANPSPGRPSYLAALYRCLAEEAIEDENFCIGPSYFMHKDLTETTLKRIWQRSIMPYLREYHFDRQNRADVWAWDGEKVRSIRGS